MPTLIPPDAPYVQQIVRAALAEDIGAGDITSALLLPEGTRAAGEFRAREALTACGLFVAEEVFRQLGGVQCSTTVEEGAQTEAGAVLLCAEGDAHALLAGERTALNFLQRMAGVAGLTRRYAAAVEGTKARILDTRKTVPGLRLLDKYAVAAGGGVNHRLGLFDAVLIKDNHLALRKRVAEAIRAARAGCRLPVIVECDTLDQVREALSAAPDRILLDNMSVQAIAETVRLAGGRVALEASGGITLANVRAVAETGVDFISVGALTHSAGAADIGLDIRIGPA